MPTTLIALLLVVVASSCAPDRASPPAAAPPAPLAVAPPSPPPPAPPDAPLAAIPVDAPGPSQPDLSRLPPFAPTTEVPGPAWTWNEIDELLDPFHQHPEDALKPALAAVEQQPNRATERYMLACALAASGLHADAQHVLEALRAARDCPSCRDALLNAPSDAECTFGPDEVAVARGVAPSPLLVAARAVLASLRSGDPAPALPYLDPARPASFSIMGLECDTECTTTKAYTRAAFIALIREGKSEYRDPTRMFCNRECCSGPNPSHTHAPIVHMTELCFRPGARPRLRSLAAGLDG